MTTREHYDAELRRRLSVLRKLREKPALVAPLRRYYADNPAAFIGDWGVTYDPRNVAKGLPAVVPFMLFERQQEYIAWVLDRWRGGENGLCEKSRDTGVSWLSVALSCSLCLFHEDLAIGFGSRKEEYVDKLDSPKALFFKARMFMQYIPREFRGGWNLSKHAPHMRVLFPDANSVITGEAGDNIGRGDRTAIYFVDEAAHIERPELIEASLSATTDCRIDVSSVKGMNNPFAQKRHSWPAHRIFTFHWRSDPRKTERWYQGLAEQGLDPVTIAQEYDINYTASVSGVVIPNEWVQAAIDAHVKLGIQPRGKRRGALDVADEGIDLNAFAGGHGILLEYVDAWSGVGADIFDTTKKAFDICEAEGYGSFRYDADGLGAGVRGDARKLNEERKAKVDVTAFRGSGAVIDPDAKIPTVDNDAQADRTNGDYFHNAKAQAWFALRMRFLRTFRAVTQGHPISDPDDLISISSKLPQLAKLTTELSQPTYKESGAGKLLINKQPDGTRSPNLADAVMILFAPSEKPRGSFFK